MARKKAAGFLDPDHGSAAHTVFHCILETDKIPIFPVSCCSQKIARVASQKLSKAPNFSVPCRLFTCHRPIEGSSFRDCIISKPGHKNAQIEEFGICIINNVKSVNTIPLFFAQSSMEPNVAPCQLQQRLIHQLLTGDVFSFLDRHPRERGAHPNQPGCWINVELTNR